jgi:imidazolonepropionase-like amidohydrolase
MLGFEIRLAIERGYIEGPRLLVAGRPITGTAGHFNWCNGVADEEEEIRRAVRQLVAEGADHIKVMASGGGTLGTDPTRASYTVSELRAATTTAHELGRLVTAHCRAKDAMDRAVEANLDCIEHGEFLDHDGVPRFDANTAKRMRDSGTFLSPTLAATDWDTILRLRAKRDESGLDAPEATILGAAEDFMKRRLEVVNSMLDIGYGDHVVASTDAGCFDYSFGHMDYNLFLLVEAGMSPMEAIMAGTRVSAAACGVGDLVGTLEPGKSADILLVDGNPLDDIEAVGRVAAVFKAGVQVPLPPAGVDGTRTSVR